METINVVLKTGYKLVKDLSEQHKPVSFHSMTDELILISLTYFIIYFIIVDNVELSTSDHGLKSLFI